MQIVNDYKKTIDQNIHYLGGWKDSPTCRHNLDEVTCRYHKVKTALLYFNSITTFNHKNLRQAISRSSKG